jgi:hypothetical protein
VRSLYFKLFSASFLITFLSPEIAASINMFSFHYHGLCLVYCWEWFCQLELVLLLLSSVFPLCRVSTLIFLRQTMSLENTVLHLFWCNFSWCVYRLFLRWLHCISKLALLEVCVQCLIWLFSVVP